MNRPLSPAELIARHVRTGEPHECWPCTCMLSNHGYGTIHVGPKGQRRTMSAHRLAWIVANGEIPHGMWVLHHCDNPVCCNPAHLYIGTQADNEADKVKRGRVVGERNPNARFNEIAVRVVRLLHARGVSTGDLARAHNCTYGVIQCIVARTRWASVA